MLLPVFESSARSSCAAVLEVVQVQGMQFDLLALALSAVLEVRGGAGLAGRDVVLFDANTAAGLSPLHAIAVFLEHGTDQPSMCCLQESSLFTCDVKAVRRCAQAPIMQARAARSCEQYYLISVYIMHVPSLPSLSAPQFELTESDGLANSDGSELMEEDDSEEAPRGSARTSREGHSLLCQSLVISTVARRSMVIILIKM
jgi:hypothetical protein